MQSRDPPAVQIYAFLIDLERACCVGAPDEATARKQMSETDGMQASVHALLLGAYPSITEAVEATTKALIIVHEWVQETAEKGIEDVLRHARQGSSGGAEPDRGRAN